MKGERQPNIDNNISLTHDVEVQRDVLKVLQQHLIPFLMLLYVFAYLDRINVSFASLQMNKDLGFSASTYGLGAGIFFLGYFLVEVPSNLMLERVGARLWIARIVFTWGIIASLMAFVKNPTSFYILRFLLGVAEAGFFPGIILYLSYWFPTASRARAVASFMTATAFAGAIGSPLSGAILNLNGMGKLAGWQWLFLIEGIPSILLTVVVLKFLPNGPAEAKWLSPLEQTGLIRQLQAEHTLVQTRQTHSLREALTSSRVLVTLHGRIRYDFRDVWLWLLATTNSQRSFPRQQFSSGNFVRHPLPHNGCRYGSHWKTFGWNRRAAKTYFWLCFSSRLWPDHECLLSQ